MSIFHHTCVCKFIFFSLSQISELLSTAWVKGEELGDG